MLGAIVFDFDGVIVDSEPLHLRAYQDMLWAVGLSLGRDEYYDRYLGFDDAGMFRVLAADRDFKLDDRRLADLVRRKSARFERLVAGTDILFPGAAECVRRSAAEVPVAIASGASRREIEMILTASGLLSCFQAIVAAGDVDRSKPAPDMYARALELLGVRPARAVAVEDSRRGLEAARAAGLRLVAVTHTYPAEDLALADLVVAGMAEITLESLRRLVDR